MSIAPGLLFAGELSGIRVSSGPTSTRVVLDLDRMVRHDVFQLSDPNRIVIDLPDTSVGDSLRLPEAKGRVRSVRTGARPGGELRVVLELSGPARAESFELDPEGGFGHRLVVDLSAGSTTVAPASAAAPAARLVDVYTGRDLIVAIDAGHGGKDPGTSDHGVREKDVVLQIARRLAELLEREPGLRPVLIRDGDKFLELTERVRRAHSAQADLFISIHADWNENSKISGAAVYSIDTGRAATEAARRLADRENAADLIGGVSLSDKDDAIARVLLDLSQSASISKSLAAGDSVIKSLGRVTSLRKSDVQQGRFAVLTSPDIPSLLVETAFLSNPREASNMRDTNYQQALAQALFSGILDFFRTNSPPESYLAHNPPSPDRAPIRHVIARGETLSEIAERYRVSLPVLRSANAINGDVIRVGQVLTIPTTS